MPSFNAHTTFRYPDNKMEMVEKGREMAGKKGLNGLLLELLEDYVNRQGAMVQQDPLGLRYESSSQGLHWSDSLKAVDLNEMREDIRSYTDEATVNELYSKVASAKEELNKQSMVIRRNKTLSKVVSIKEEAT
jgi:hypothetical protein